MRKPILAALIAATALMPFAASAQDGRGRRERAEGQPRAERPAPSGNVNRDAFRTMIQQRRAERQAAAPAPARQAFRQERREDRGQFRQERRDDRQDFRRERRDDRQAFQNGQVTQQQFRADRRDDRRDFRADRRDDRQDFRRDRRDDRQDYRADRRDWDRGRDWSRDGSADRRDWSRSSNGRSDWNRSWRNDRRYDWRGYRSSNRNTYRLPRYYAPRGYGYGYQRFGIGVTLGSVLFSQNYWINDPFSFRLPPAYGPYRWVRYYNDALLVDVRTGFVVDVEYDVFW